MIICPLGEVCSTCGGVDGVVLSQEWCLIYVVERVKRRTHLLGTLKIGVGTITRNGTKKRCGGEDMNNFHSYKFSLLRTKIVNLL